MEIIESKSSTTTFNRNYFLVMLFLLSCILLTNGQTVAQEKNMLVHGNFADGIKNWAVEQNGDATCQTDFVKEGPGGIPALRLKVLTIADKAWKIQFYQTGPKIEKGKTYDLTFWAKSDRTSNIKVLCAMNHDPWEHGTGELFPLSTEWQQIHFIFVAPWTDDNMRITFTDLGNAVGQNYWLANCSLISKYGVNNN